ncbi:MAG: nucleotidyltransferase domain-containing protein [Deltaproteobacteria bacterium]|nr:nucleotidyltransferase domain-containing protein [Deltaproteobacteria bacterium]
MRINSRETILRELQRLKPDFAQRYGVTKIGIFGSFARNDIREDSDVDIVVEMKPDLIKRASLKAELESFFGKNIDVVRYRRGMNRFLKKRIDAEALYV